MKHYRHQFKHYHTTLDVIRLRHVWSCNQLDCRVACFAGRKFTIGVRDWVARLGCSCEHHFQTEHPDWEKF